MKTLGRLLGYVIVIGAILGFAYWYNFAHSACRTPVQYDIGTMDQRFNLSRDELKSAISDAESLWEDATGKNLFTYTPGAAFKINLVYDDRQKTTTEADKVRATLDDQQAQNESIKTQYQNLSKQYSDLKASYETATAAYEAKLKAYNDEVASWNKKGGAPKEIFGELQSRQADLAKENQSLNTTAQKLNELVAALNALGKEGNQAVATYNQQVSWYNKIFGTGREFTQGEYKGDRINVYQFKDGNELRLVLAHELGHALSLGHVQDPHAVMYYLMEGQLGTWKLSSADIAEYQRVCGAK